MKGFRKRYMVENVWEKVAEKLDFVENSNFILESTKIKFCKFLEKYPWRNTIAVNLHNLKACNFTTIGLAQAFSCEVVFLYSTFNPLFLELVSENILKSSCCENYFDLC